MSAKLSRKKPKNRQTKFFLIFDEKERQDYLKGFSKRKAERKKKAFEELQKCIKEEKKRIKQKKVEEYRNMIASQRTVPEVAHLVDPIIYESPHHTVTITPVNDDDLNKNFLYIGSNTGNSSQNLECKEEGNKDNSLFDLRLSKKKIRKWKSSIDHQKRKMRKNHKLIRQVYNL